MSLIALLAAFHEWLEHEWMDEMLSTNEARRVYILVDCLQAMVRGLIVDGVFAHGFMAIDDYDFAEWLERHGASRLALESAPLRGYYDYFFGYEDGDPAKPQDERRHGAAAPAAPGRRLQGSALLEDAVRHGRRRVRAALRAVP